MRITGGIHRSRPLKAPRGTATRPTSDRVREGLFGMLEARALVRGARVLDLYAGTGALGLEALSRGARHATFVERGREALDALGANVDALRANAQARIVRSSVEGAGPRVGGPFELVLVDPPYADVPSGAVARALMLLRDRLAPGATLVLEHASGDSPPEMCDFRRGESRRYGDTTLTFCEVAQS